MGSIEDWLKEKPDESKVWRAKSLGTPRTTRRAQNRGCLSSLGKVLLIGLATFCVLHFSSTKRQGPAPWEHTAYRQNTTSSSYPQPAGGSRNIAFRSQEQSQSNLPPGYGQPLAQLPSGQRTYLLPPGEATAPSSQEPGVVSEWTWQNLSPEERMSRCVHALVPEPMNSQVRSLSYDYGRDDAQDVVSTAVEKVCTRYRTDHIEAIRPYFFAALQRSQADWARERSSRAQFCNQYLNICPSRGASYNRIEQQEWVEAGLCQLPPRDQRIVSLKLRGYSDTEVAELLLADGIALTPGNVATIDSRARRKLQNYLSDCGYN